MRYFPNQRPNRLPMTREEYFAARRRARRWEWVFVAALGIIAGVVFMVSNGGFH